MILSSILLINVLCTIIDEWFFQCTVYNMKKTKKREKSSIIEGSAPSFKLKEAFKCFSIIRNIKALFDLNTLTFDHILDRKNDSVHQQQSLHSDIASNKSAKRTDSTTAGIRRFVSLDAIRLILVLNVCIDHMFLFTPFMAFMAFKRILNSVITKVYYYNKYFFARNILIIDTLFIISGLVLSFSLLRKLSLSRGRLQYGIFLVRLWLKYSLPMAVVISFFWLLPLTGTGPIWQVGMHLLVPACKDHFSLFSSLTYFSNYRIKATKNVFHFDPQFAVVG